MTPFEVSEKYTEQLQALAHQDERTVQAVVDEALSFYLLERHLDHIHNQPALPVTQLPRNDVSTLLQRRTRQSSNCEVVTSEEVDVWFDNLFKELEVR